MSTHQGAFTKRRSSTALLLGGVLAASFLVYLGTLQFEFVYDDLGQIVTNPAVQSWKYFPLYFRTNVWMQQLPVGNYYRPLFLAWLLINHTLFGLHPALWHLTTVLAHVGVTALVYALALRLTRDRRIALVAALVVWFAPSAPGGRGVDFGRDRAVDGPAADPGFPFLSELAGARAACVLDDGSAGVLCAGLAVEGNLSGAAGAGVRLRMAVFAGSREVG